MGRGFEPLPRSNDDEASFEASSPFSGAYGRRMGFLTTSVDAGVATVTIDHPPINLMTVPVYLELAELVDRLADDDDVRVVVLRSANPEWFIAHFDVEAILGFPTDPPAPPATELNLFHGMCERLRTMPKATIAVIEGRVGGGGSEVALSCDMRFASPAMRCSTSRRWRSASSPVAAAPCGCRA